MTQVISDAVVASQRTTTPSGTQHMKNENCPLNAAEADEEANRLGILLARLCYPEAVERHYQGVYLRAYVKGAFVAVGFEVDRKVDRAEIANQFLRFAQALADESGLRSEYL